jgi:hypothetical protein
MTAVLTLFAPSEQGDFQAEAAYPRGMDRSGGTARG